MRVYFVFSYGVKWHLSNPILSDEGAYIMYSRADIHSEITSKFGGHGRILLLTDNVLDKCDSWYKANIDSINGKKPAEIRKNLKSYIMQEVRVSKGDNPYTFIPAFIWLWIAGQIISFIIEWWIKNNNLT